MESFLKSVDRLSVAQTGIRLDDTRTFFTKLIEKGVRQ